MLYTVRKVLFRLPVICLLYSRKTNPSDTTYTDPSTIILGMVLKTHISPESAWTETSMFILVT